MKEQVFLSKNYTIIQSSVPFRMIFNRRDSSASSGEDVIEMKSGWYIFNNNDLLRLEVDGVKNSPKYNLWLDYDSDSLGADGVFKWYTTWVNPKSIDSLDTDVTEISAPQLMEILEAVKGKCFFNIPISQFPKISGNVGICGRGVICVGSTFYHFDSVLALSMSLFDGGGGECYAYLDNGEGIDLYDTDISLRFCGRVIDCSAGSESAYDAFVQWLNEKNFFSDRF